MIKSKIILVIIILLLTVGNLFFIGQYLTAQKELREAQTALKIQNINEKVLEFTSFFIEEVISSDSEVDFETRLKLENMVRGLNDEDILQKWNSFVASPTQEEAQQQVKTLLKLLVKKIETRR